VDDDAPGLVGLGVQQGLGGLTGVGVVQVQAVVRGQQEAARLAQRDAAHQQFGRQPLRAMPAGGGFVRLQGRPPHVHPPQALAAVAPERDFAQDVGPLDHAFDLAGHRCLLRSCVPRDVGGIFLQIIP